MKDQSVIREDLINITSAPLPWNEMSDKTVLISGANGFLSAYMVETLLYLNESQGLNIQIIGLVRNLDRARERFVSYAGRGELSFVRGDVSDIALQDLPHADFIIHAASQASPKYYGSDPVGTLSANTFGTANLLKHAVNCKSVAFLYLSSGEVYGEVAAEHIPTSERDYGYVDPLNVRSCYAESKRMGENMCVSWHHQFGVNAKIVRPFHTYGPGMRLDDGRVYADFVRSILNGEDIRLNSDGSATRAFCYLSDAVKGFFYVLLKGQPAAAYNVGNPEQECSILNLAKALVVLRADKKLQVHINHAASNGYIPSAITRNVPKIDAAMSLGWKPSIEVEEGFSRTLRHYESKT